MHRLCLFIRNEETNIIPLDGLATEDVEALSTLSQEIGNSFTNKRSCRITLTEGDTDADAVDGSFDEDSLVFVVADGDGVEDDFGGGLDFDFGFVMALDDGGGEGG